MTKFRVAILLPSALLAACLVLGACGGNDYRILTASELSGMGTRSYQGRTVEQLTDATSKALQGLGYKITVEDKSRGLLRTAPQVIRVDAVRTGPGSAMAQEDALAWNVQVVAVGSGAQVTLTPRAIRNGDDISHLGFADTVIGPKFGTVFSEIDSVLTMASVPPAPSSTP